jgi:TPR repeat protein
MNGAPALVVLLISLGSLSISLQHACALSPGHIPSDRGSLEPDKPIAQDQPVSPRPTASTSQEDLARAEAFHERGRARLASGDLPGAITELREALRLEPRFIHARVSLGLALYNQGDVDGAIAEYRAALSMEPELARARVGLATALMVKHEWAGARAELEETIRLQPDFVQAHDSLGAVRYTMGDIPGAIEAYREALRLKPDYADAHYHLGLMLKLANHETESAAELLVAARAGLPDAQYFLGTAYQSGHGVERNLTAAITWWFRAAEQGMTQAKEALAQLRQRALLKGKHSPEESRLIVEAFTDYRKGIWSEFPELTPNGPDVSVGLSLVRQSRIQEAIPVLLREAYALSDPAQAQLETLYKQGVEGQLVPYDDRILAYFKTTAAEGLPHPRLVLARIYARGLGVTQDRTKAIALLKGNPEEEAKRLLKDLSGPAQDADRSTKSVQPRSVVTP